MESGQVSGQAGKADGLSGGMMLYVSPGGSDTWTGRLATPNADRSDGPLRSLEAARDALRQLRRNGALDGGATVVLCGGMHLRDRRFELTAEDSGSPGAPIVYRAAQGAPGPDKSASDLVRLVGGREVKGFRPVDDPTVLARLAPPARGKVLVADLKKQGITDLGEMKSRGFGRSITPAGAELFFNDEPMTLARWPNEGFVTIAGFPQSGATKDEHGGDMGKLEEGFLCDGDRPGRWQDVSNLWVHGYWAWDWANSYEKVESIDLKTRHIKTAPPHGLYGFRAGQRICFLNVLEELDEPGEWFLDRKGGLLYFWPPAPIESGRAILSMLAEPMIVLDGASHVEIRCLTLECARGHGIRIVGGESNLVAGCTIRNVGNYGVWVDGGKGHGVAGCDIYNTGDGGVCLIGGDRKTLAPCGHFAHNNHLHHIGRWSKCYVPAVLARGVGCRISHNLIHDHPHCAICFDGNEMIIELNEIHHVALETGDVGAIYAGRDWTYRGNVIRHNYIHHTGGVGMGSMGVYMDDCVSGTRITGNVFVSVQRAVFLGGGRDFVVENNIFVACRPAVQVDGRGLERYWVWHDMVYKTMKQRLEAMNWRNPPYSTRYPELADLDKYYQKDDGVPPGNILVARNLCVGKEWLEAGWGASEKDLELKDNLVVQKTDFANEDKGDFRLKGTAAVPPGFQHIPMDQIGLIRDEYRPGGK